jgi:2-hydroxy-6-oxonona-2,4-dienedioate hydrolase
VSSLVDVTVQQYPLGLDGVVTRVLDTGVGDDVLVCLHGAGSRADRWRPALPLLAAEGFRVLAVDFPGHGLAARPEGYPHGTPAYTAAVVELLDALGLQQVTILGTSLGGHVAASVALARPTAVRATVLIGAVGLVPPEPAAEAAGSPIVDTSEAGTRAKLEFLVHDPTLLTDEWVREETLVGNAPGTTAARAELARYLADDMADDLVGADYAALGLPTHLVWGAEDRWITPAIGRATAELLPDAELVLVPDAGHAPYYERPEAFMELVRPFLAAHAHA